MRNLFGVPGNHAFGNKKEFQILRGSESFRFVRLTNNLELWVKGAESISNAQKSLGIGQEEKVRRVRWHKILKLSSWKLVCHICIKNCFWSSIQEVLLYMSDFVPKIWNWDFPSPYIFFTLLYHSAMWFYCIGSSEPGCNLEKPPSASKQGISGCTVSHLAIGLLLTYLLQLMIVKNPRPEPEGVSPKVMFPINNDLACLNSPKLTTCLDIIGWSRRK